MTRTERLDAEDEALLRNLYPMLVRFGAVVGGQDVEPEDLVQEAVYRTLRVHALGELENPAAYLRQTMVSIASNQRKRRDQWRRFVSRSGVVSTQTQSFPSDIDDLLRLSPATRAILYLTVVEGVTLAEARLLARGQAIRLANAPDNVPIALSYEAAYRFVAQYYDRERIVPLMLMLSDMAWEEFADHHRTSDPAHWFDWMRCIQQTIDGAPLPEIAQPRDTPG